MMRDTLGNAVAEAILALAGLLADSATPGLVSLALVLVLAIQTVRFAWWAQERQGALRAFEAAVVGGGEAPFAEIEKAVAKSLERPGEPAKALREAWREFGETLVQDQRGVIRNSVRPSAFFGLEELGFTDRGWRSWPALFVSTGLLLTFLGLIAALGEAGARVRSDPDVAVTGLLAVASAKFIMSLTGLACSILFGILLRRGLARLERASHDLCLALEERLTWISLERTALDQLRTLADLKEHMTAQTTALVAELGRALDQRLEALGEAIAAPVGKAIATALTPALTAVTQAAQSGVGTLVKDLGDRISGEVGAALANASELLAEAADRLDKVATGFGESFAAASRELSSAAERLAASADVAVSETSRAVAQALAETLAGLRTALAEIEASARRAGEAAAGTVAAAGGKAAVEVKDSAEKLAGTLDDMAGAAAERANEVAKALAAVTAKAAEATDRAAALGTQMTRGAEAADRAAGAFGKAAAAAERAAGNLAGGAGAMAKAAEPVARAADGVGAAAEAVRKAATGIAQSARELLEGTAAALAA